MIRFSFSSFYMSIIFSNIIIVILYVIFRSRKRMARMGLISLAAILCAAATRMIFPVEFLFLSRNIHLPQDVSYFIGEFLTPRFLNGRLSAWSILQIAWVARIVYLLVRFIRKERATSKAIMYGSRSLPLSSPAVSIFRDIQKEHPKAKRIRLRTFSNLKSPGIYGVWHPYLLLPDDLPLSEEQLPYILRHEVSHYLHHDLYLKLGLELLCIVYWWNPLCSFLKDKAGDILEMRVDYKIIKTPEQKKDYFDCLLYVANHTTRSKNNFTSPASISFYNPNVNFLAQRFIMISEGKISLSNRIRRALLLVSLTALFSLSYLFILEARYACPNDLADTLIPTKDNSYFIEKDDGTYDLYMDNVLIDDTINSLEHYPSSIPIYKERR